MIKSVFFLAAFIVSSYAHAGVLGDVDGDGQVGLNEAIYSLQSLAGIRPPIAAGLKNVITVAKANGDFTDPVAAVNSISDASATNPYLVVIGPGVYTITETLQMKPYVDIAGSGENVTRIKGAISTAAPASSAIIFGADNSTLSALTAENTGGGAYSVVLHNDSQSPMLRDITAIASGGPGNYGVYNVSSSPTMTGVTITASGGSYNVGIYNYNSSSPMIISVAATASGPSSYGAYNNSSSPVIRRSTMKGDTNSVYSHGASVTISQSTLIGPAWGASYNQCVACDNGSGVALGANCE
jgi:hypothetical protein